MTNSGQWVKGVSGNPKGRPKKGAALTDLLKTQLEKTIIDVDGTRKKSGKRVLARIAVEAVTTGRLRFVVERPSGETHIVTQALEPREWMTWAKWIYAQIDGPPVNAIDITTSGEGLNRNELTDTEINERIVAILDTARARRDGSADDDAGQPEAISSDGGGGAES